MMPVSGYPDFLQKFNAVKNSSRLFTFILFDDRKSQAPVGAFVEANMGWLDSLAASANMFCFAFARDGGGVAANPSLEVASHFGIRPNQLPGIVAFTMLPLSEKVDQALYLPLDSKLFASGDIVVEQVFSDLFSAFQRVQELNLSETALHERLNDEIAALHREQRMRPFLRFIGDRLETLAKLPDKILLVAAEAFGQQAGKALLGG